MKIKALICISILFFSSQVKAQLPLNFLNQLAEKSPIQKIYLQLDRENYVAGQVAQFKAYLTTDFLPDAMNTTMYAELYDDGLKLINKSVFPVLFGSAVGSIVLPDSLLTGYYTIRSFSAGMLWQNVDYFAQQKKYVSGIEKKEKVTSNDSLSVAFFPEGGSLVNDLAGTVAFKVTDKKGIPVDVIGNLYNDKNEDLVYLSCLQDGMGLFDFKPKKGEKYYVKLKTNLPDKKYYLPEAQDKGVTLSIIAETGGNAFEIKQKTGDPTFEAAYMIGQIQHHVAFKIEFSKQKDILKGVINTKDLPSGIMQITVFNKDDMPLAERLIFVNNYEYTLACDVKVDTLDFLPGGRNKFFISMKDTVQGQISVSITDPDFDLIVKREHNIISSLLLTSDLKGHIWNAAWYLSSSEDSVKNALDLLMMVNGWRRFKWSEINMIQKTPKPSNAFISLTGNVTLQGTKKPFANKQMILMTRSNISKNKRSMLYIATDKDGMFKIDSLIFFDKNKLLFLDTRGKKSDAIDVYLDMDTLFASVPLPVRSWFTLKDKKEILNPQIKIDYDKAQKARGLLLNEVILITKKKSKTTIIEDKYVSGLFGTNARTTIDLVNSDEASGYANIFDYLRSNINGLQVLNDGANYKLYYRSNASGSNLGNSPMTIYLDEMETDASAIENIPASQIALVKVFSTFLGGTGNTQDGAIAIYSKKAEDYKNPSPESNIKIYNGYTISKEFYAPDYRVSKTGLDNDNRTTIDWRPQIFINNINPKIPISFYNNNRTKSFKIIVEGITNKGKLIWLEKIINK
jgi:hypothetical protein